MLILFFGSVYLWWIRNTCQARADFQGIFGYPAGLHVRRRMVPWSEIETCELLTQYDTFGRLVLIVPVFKDAFGTRVLTLNLMYSRVEDQERLVKYTKAKLPKSRLELTEL